MLFRSATVRVDDALPRGGLVARDILGLAPSEVVRLVRQGAERDIIDPAILRSTRK